MTTETIQLTGSVFLTPEEYEEWREACEEAAQLADTYLPDPEPHQLK